MSSALIDISMPVAQGMTVWPGDTETRTRWNMRLEKGDSANLGTIELSLHAGTHADAPLHFAASGAPIDQLDLDAFWGPVRVVDACGLDELGPGLFDDEAERWLIRTGAWHDRRGFPESIPVLTEAAIARLGGMHATLVGLDLPSVDPLDSKSLSNHHHLERLGIRILENLVLDHVKPGEYELSAIPLRICGMDASPVRAVLRAL